MALVGALGQRALRQSAPGERIAFGPALAAAGWLVWLYGPLAFG